MSEIDLKEYSQFVDKVTSSESKDSTAFRQRLDDLGNGDIPRLLTAAMDCQQNLESLQKL